MTPRFTYKEFLITDGSEDSYCLRCGEPAKYQAFGYTWCEKDKRYLRKDPEELEGVVFRRLKSGPF